MRAIDSGSVIGRSRSVDALIDDRAGEGIFKVHADVYTDPAVLDWEFEHIFEKTWIFLGFESQIPNRFDFFTGHIGRVPVLVSRDGDGKVHGFINACRHKGLKLCVAAAGHARSHICPYHGWSYDASGRNIKIKDQAEGGYPDAFLTQDVDLLPVARIASYKGLIFGSLSREVPALEDFLGGIRFFIDLAMEQGPQGMEPVPGRTVYTYRGNWKYQFDNGLDSYHLTSTHVSFMEVLRRRRAGLGSVANTQTDFSRTVDKETNTFNFANGHGVITVENFDRERRPYYHRMDEIRARVGDMKADWMLETFNSNIFPSLQIANNSALILRTFRPLAVDLTEMTAYCLGAVGEEKTERAARLRSFEDFFNATGMATPDDIAAYERCHAGLAGGSLDWLNGYSRGFAHARPGANAMADSIGLHPTTSTKGTMKSGQEVPFQGLYREWSRLIRTGLAAEKAYA